MFVSFSFVGFATNLLAGDVPLPRIDVDPKPILMEYMKCSCSDYVINNFYKDKTYKVIDFSDNNKNTPAHIMAIAKWFKAFKHSFIVENPDDIRRLSSRETRQLLFRIIAGAPCINHYSNHTVKSPSTSLVNLIYKQSEMALAWADVAQIIVEMKKKNYEAEIQARELERAINEFDIHAEELERQYNKLLNGN